jgi:protocatechuate 3,4-dioxygenase beta subunit
VRGRVVAAGTGSPIRRAVVNLSPAPPPIQSGAAVQPSVSVQPLPPATPFGPQRRTVTDAEGRFAFADVASGNYRIFVNPGQHSGQHVSIAYGAKPSEGPLGSDPGLTIQLSDGQTIDKVVIALPRGAVISGRIMDDVGEPLARVQVYALAFPAGSPRGIRIGSGAQTDDLGQFRLFGLQSGEFVVAAEARNNTMVSPNTPPSEADQVGFMTTYYPGVTDESAAQRVRARAGTETSGVEIRVGSGRLFRVSGTILDAEGRAVSRGNGQLVRRGTAFGNTQNFFFSTDEQGAFQMQSIPPGDYRLVMRYPNYAAMQGVSPPDPQLAYQAVTVAGDTENLAVVLRVGTTITGQVYFEQEPPASALTQLRIMATSANPEDGMGMGLTPSPIVSNTRTFTLKGLIGEYFLRLIAPYQSIYVKSITADGEDITDAAREFKASDRIVITLTSRASIVEGIVTDPRGTPSGVGIIMFADERALWQTNATRTKRTGVDANGAYRVSGLMPGRYYIIAVPRERLTFPANAVDSAYFEQLSKDAETLVIGDSEQRRVDLRVQQLDR